MLQAMLSFFYPDETQMSDILNKEKIQSLIYLLEIHGASTAELIMKYQHGRYNEQVKIPSKQAENGLLTFRANYCEDNNTLRIEILNARNLKAMDSNGLLQLYLYLLFILTL